jgi:hypothetical protein
MLKRIGFLISIIFVLVLSACASDTTSPVINGLKDFEYVIGDAIPDFSNSITATDDVDGDISSSITFDQTAVDFTTPGTYTVTVLVTDSSGNETEATFNVIVTLESIPPVISGAKDFTVQRFAKEVDAFSGISALDNVDGDVTANIVFDDKLVLYDKLGSYDAFYRVFDAAGNKAEVKVTVTVTGLSDTEIVAFEVAHFQSNPLASANRINLSTTGSQYPVKISWNLNHPSVMSSGIFLSLDKGETPQDITYTGTFSLGDVSVTETFTFTLEPYKGAQIENSRVLPFRNLTTEYDVADGELELFFEKDGEVPYVSIRDFLNLIKGFIDPVYEITFTETETTLTLFYQYYDEDEDITYDLEVILDTVLNTITTNDPGFYWAYVATTETNFGRHIVYVDADGEHYEEGTNIVYELGKYQMDIVSSDKGILIPFYIANQLFAGSSYYNVYYNYDGLFGIYSTPDSDSEEFKTIRTSTRNSTSIPDDLIVHNFHMLNFSLDYFYGLRKYLGIDTFYEITRNRAEGLLNTTSRIFETTLRDLLLKDIDEPHTSYGFASYYNRVTYEGPPVNSLSVYGQRFNDWYMSGFSAVNAQIEAKWGRVGITSNAWAATSKSRPNFWFLDNIKKSVVVTLDNFRTSDIQESLTHNLDHVRDVLEVEDVSFLPSIDTGNKFFYFKNSTDEVLILELLVKGVEASFKEVYEQALISKGFILVKETSTDELKVDGYYKIVIGEVSYMVQVGYDTVYNLFYVSVANNVPELYEDDWDVTKDIQALVKSDSAVYLEEVLENAFNESPNIENIMLDITWNTGGNVGALYRVIGFMTNQPFLVSRISGDTNSKSSSFVQVVGVPEYHTYKWAVLTSPLSFSAANSLANIVKENNIATVIGLQTGGGASSITPILLPVGSSFTMSSNSVSAYRRGLGTEESPYTYYDTEFGIRPNIVITIDKIFDPATLMAAFR